MGTSSFNMYDKRHFRYRIDASARELGPSKGDPRTLYLFKVNVWEFVDLDDTRSEMGTHDGASFWADSEAQMERLVTAVEGACREWRERKRTGPNGEEEEKAAVHLADCGC